MIKSALDNRTKDQMATATIFSHATDILSWKATGSSKTKTTSSTTLVTNSSGATVYWDENGSNGSIANNGTLNCVQGPIDKTWDFSESSGGTVRITLTVTSSGSAPSQKKPAPHGNS